MAAKSSACEIVVLSLYNNTISPLRHDGYSDRGVAARRKESGDKSGGQAKAIGKVGDAVRRSHGRIGEGDIGEGDAVCGAARSGPCDQHPV